MHYYLLFVGGMIGEAQPPHEHEWCAAHLERNEAQNSAQLTIC